MYSIYESYKQVKEGITDLTSGDIRSNVANNTSRNNSNLPQGALSINNEEIKKLPKGIARLLVSLTNSANRADHSSVLVDCANLRRELTKYRIDSI